MPERRTTAKLIRFRPEELARITARARACGRTPACFIRETALGAIPRPRPDAAADPLLCELARVGRRLDTGQPAQAGQDTAARRVALPSTSTGRLVRRMVKDLAGSAKVAR
jgi:hypothetical protein